MPGRRRRRDRARRLRGRPRGLAWRGRVPRRGRRPVRSTRRLGSAARSPTTRATGTGAWRWTGARTRRSPGCPAHRRSPIAGLPFANPMSEAAVDRVLDALRLPAGALVLDTGCGSGEMLLRALEHDPTWRGLGVDLDEDAIAEARAAPPGVCPAATCASRSATPERSPGATTVCSTSAPRTCTAATRRRSARCGRWWRTAAPSSTARATGARSRRRVPRRTRRSDRGRARHLRWPAVRSGRGRL